MENLQPSSSHILAAATLNFLSLVFVQFVNIKTQFCSSDLFFKDTKFSMHKLVWNRMEFPIQEKREECFRNQNSLLPVFLLQHKHHKSAHSQEERGKTLNSDLLMVRHDGKKLLLQLGRFVVEGLPVNLAF